MLQLKGKNIYLRPLTEADATETYVSWMNDPQVNQYLESRFKKFTIGDIRSYITEINKDLNNVFFAMISIDGDKHIGNIKLGPINQYHRIGDIGLIIGDKTCWGKGYATEAIGLLKDYAFNKLNLHKLTAGCYADNIGSAKAFLKVGFVEEARLASHFRRNDDKYVDKICLGMINPAEATK
ncbi:MAG: GNAT family N-acetyltransferase [Candidatus Margulisbacteria bacterium]|nr:GNAT family N-acetyltransferase [Candidatus Margulisiibacteriota bacterium]